MTASLIKVDWPAPANIHAYTSTREGGVSSAAFTSLNLADHVGDSPEAVATNRSLLGRWLGPEVRLQWLEQVHGTEFIQAGVPGVPRADGCYSDQALQACCVLTADCLPILLCGRNGSWVAAVHAGWKGLQQGIVARCLSILRSRYGDEALDPIVWLGPAIGPLNYEVGDELLALFLDDIAPSEREAFRERCFKPSTHGHKCLADLYAIARYKLEAASVSRIYGGDHCTFAQSGQFYSYRRDGQTGRMCSLIYSGPS